MKKFIYTLLLLMIIASIGLGYWYYRSSNASNVSKDAVIYIPTGTKYNVVKDLLTPYLVNPITFDLVARAQKYDRYVKAGKYKLTKGQNNRELVEMLKKGKQDYVRLRIKNYDDVYQMAGDIGKSLEVDSLKFIGFLQKIAERKGLEPEEMKIYFHPETYFIHWNTTPKQLLKMFVDIDKKFWTPERKKKAADLGLTPMEVVVLASIVQREYVTKEELPNIASLYLNRLQRRMRLQSDPTVIYAIKMRDGFDIPIKRVLNSDLMINSPYNTYQYEGLPPLPICFPSDFVIDAVLSPNQTNYLYMCAIPGAKKGHVFTDNYAEHEKNAQEYRNWLNQNKIIR